MALSKFTTTSIHSIDHQYHNKNLISILIKGLPISPNPSTLVISLSTHNLSILTPYWLNKKST